MRHQHSKAELNLKLNHARLLTRNLATSLILYESIRTTKSRARVVQPIVDRLITIAKKKEGQLAIRAINAVVTDINASKKLMEVLAKRYASRPSGFSKAKPAGARKGDGAALVDLMLIDAETRAPAAEKKEKKAAAPKKASTSAKATADKSSKATTSES